MDIVANNKTIDSGNKKRTGIVLIHGLTGTPVEMKPIEKYLSKLGMDVENVLLSGHGAGHKEMIASSWTEWMESARAGVKKILTRNDRVVICGLSMGAVIAASLAAEESRVSAIVMLSPTLYYDGAVADNNIVDSVYNSAFARSAMRQLVKAIPFCGKNFYWEESAPYGIRDERIQRQISKSIEAARLGGGNEFGVFRTYYQSFVEMWDLVDHARVCFSKVKCPVLMMHSLDDTLASIHNATETYLNIGSNNKALFLLTGCDHVMTLDLQKNLVHKMIGRFVQDFSAVSTEYRTVRSVVVPVLSEAKIAKGGNISAIISPEMHGLSKEEWKSLYPGRRFAHLASVSDVHELHSIVLRDIAQPLLSLPVFIGEYGQVTLFKNASRIWNTLSKAIAPANATVFGVGSLIVELPGLGMNKAASEESRSKALSHLIRVVESMARSSRADAYTNVQHQVPELPAPANLTRATDNKPFRLDERVHRLLSGFETFCHRNPVQGFFSRFIQVAVPVAPAEPEPIRMGKAAASVG